MKHPPLDRKRAFDFQFFGEIKERRRKEKRLWRQTREPGTKRAEVAISEALLDLFEFLISKEDHNSEKEKKVREKQRDLDVVLIKTIEFDEAGVLQSRRFAVGMPNDDIQIQIPSSLLNLEQHFSFKLKPLLREVRRG
jgi:hypothetical protein